MKDIAKCSYLLLSLYFTSHFYLVYNSITIKEIICSPTILTNEQFGVPFLSRHAGKIDIGNLLV